EFIGGSDPTVQNTASSQSAVSIQTASSANPVNVPAYSVVRIDLTAAPEISAVNNASYADGPVAAQEIVSLFGSGISSQVATGSLPLPNSLGGTSVQITDSAGASQLAQLFSVSNT